MIAVIILKSKAQIIHMIFLPVLNLLLFTNTSYITKIAHTSAINPVNVPKIAIIKPLK